MTPIPDALLAAVVKSHRLMQPQQPSPSLVSTVLAMAEELTVRRAADPGITTLETSS